MLSQEIITTIKATAPVVAQHAEDITAYFYPLMFREYPEVKAFFNQSHQSSGAQPRALANAVIAYAQNIDNLAVLESAVERIVQKHVSLGITAEQYPIVGTCLLKAIKHVLGDAATDDIMQAWEAAYNQLANLLINAEEQVYQANATKEGGWRGTRRFTVVGKEQESEIITSFYLKPSDQGTLPTFQAGQYLCLVMNINGEEIRRNYSLSDAPNKDYLRISVKREPQGLVSNYLHDEVQIGDELDVLPPAGEFVLKNNQRPLVLVTGGVGITPAISMLNASLGNTNRPIIFIHAALNSQLHAFRQHVDQLAQSHSQLKHFYAYSEPTLACRANHYGLLDTDYLAQCLAGENDVDLYLLGPKPFMQSIYQSAKTLGIPENQTYFEFFGPAESLVA